MADLVIYLPVTVRVASSWIPPSANCQPLTGMYTKPCFLDMIPAPLLETSSFITQRAKSPCKIEMEIIPDHKYKYVVTIIKQVSVLSDCTLPYRSAWVGAINDLVNTHTLILFLWRSSSAGNCQCLRIRWFSFCKYMEISEIISNSESLPVTVRVVSSFQPQPPLPSANCQPLTGMYTKPCFLDMILAPPLETSSCMTQFDQSSCKFEMESYCK